MAKAARLSSRRLLMAEMAEAEKAWPHSPSAIPFTFRVETPCTYISASVATSACSETCDTAFFGGVARRSDGVRELVRAVMPTAAYARDRA